MTSRQVVRLSAGSLILLQSALTRGRLVETRVLRLGAKAGA
jgi:hypothetical protein